MSIETVHAIVLRRRDAGESDRRLTLLTQELGVIDVLAKGARKPGSRLSGSSEPMTACILGLTPSKHLRFVTQTQPISAFPKLRGDFDRLTYGLALCELAATILPHEAPADESFSFMAKALSYLEVHERPLVCLIWAESRLMDIGGFRPQFSRCVSSDRGIQLAEEWVSPHAGGMVDASHAARYNDRILVSAEVLYGAARIVDLEEPPHALKLASQVFEVLVKFWEGMTDHKLPAHTAVIQALRESDLNAE